MHLNIKVKFKGALFYRPIKKINRAIDIRNSSLPEMALKPCVYMCICKHLNEPRLVILIMRTTAVHFHFLKVLHFKNLGLYNQNCFQTSYMMHHVHLYTVMIRDLKKKKVSIFVDNCFKCTLIQ